MKLKNKFLQNHAKHLEDCSLGAVQILRKHLGGERGLAICLFLLNGGGGCLNDAYVRHFRNILVCKQKKNC